MKVIVIMDGREVPAYHLRARQVIVATSYDHSAQTMTITVVSQEEFEAMDEAMRTPVADYRTSPDDYVL